MGAAMKSRRPICATLDGLPQGGLGTVSADSRLGFCRLARTAAWQAVVMRDLHVDFWVASASIAPIIGLTHYVLTRTLYHATADLYRAERNNLSGDAEQLRKYLACLSNWSMGAIASCILVMSWALFCLGFAHDPSGTRAAAIIVLAASMSAAIVLGILTAMSASRLAQFDVRLQNGE